MNEAFHNGSIHTPTPIPRFVLKYLFEQNNSQVSWLDSSEERCFRHQRASRTSQKRAFVLSKSNCEVSHEVI